MLCARTSRRHRPGPSGSTRPTLSLLPPFTFATNRGAEQGDVLVLGDALDNHMRDFLSSPLEAKGICDEWLVDDGQVFVRASTSTISLWKSLGRTGQVK